jgi:hypothetical protein
MLCVVMLWFHVLFNCNADCHYAECLYAERRYAECRYAECRGAHPGPGPSVINFFGVFYALNNKHVSVV